MNTPLLSAAAQLSDQELLAQVAILAHREREATAALVAHLAVLDERQLYLGEGCSSLFTYCTQVLHLSENAAYRRVEAARVVRAYPIVLDMLAEGSISLTTIRLLAPELTPANHRKLLEASKSKPTRHVERLVARLRPLADVPSQIRQLPSRTASLVFDTAPTIESASNQPTPAESPVLEIRPPARPVVVPLSPKRFKIQFTASEETHELLRRAQDLLRHQIPNGDVGEVMAKALRVLVRELEKEKIAATDRPRRPSRGAAPDSRNIPAEVRREVWARDGGRCAFVAHNGRRCAERAFLEFHHLVPFAAGGEATVDNIQLRCRAHNGYEAELYFGQRLNGSLQNRGKFRGSMKGSVMDSRPRPQADLTRAQLQETLGIVLDHVMAAGSQIEYRLVGTAAALLHGVDLPTADVDLLVKRRADVDAFALALAPFQCSVEPGWLPEARQYYGNYKVNGVEVGISTVEVETDADTLETIGPGPWTHYVVLRCGTFDVPAVALELRLVTEVFRDRPDRYKPILGYLRAHGGDFDLIRRGLTSARMPEDLRESVLRQLIAE